MFWNWIAGAAALGAAGLIRSEYEKRCLSTDHYEIASSKIREEKTLVFLSDLHDQEFGQDNEVLMEAISREKPDLILIGGDMMVARKKEKRGQRADHAADKAWKLVRRLAKDHPVIYGNGNHEQRMARDRTIYGNAFEDYDRRLEEAGVVYLSDRNILIGEDLAVGGLNISEKYYEKRTKARMGADYVEARLGKAETERFQILLAHSPLYFDAYGEWGADLTFSGHFHGGTVRLPFVGGLMTPQFQFFYPRCAGIFQEKGKWMIVSRGLGTHSIRIRFCNKPQVVVVRLKKITTF